MSADTPSADDFIRFAEECGVEFAPWQIALARRLFPPAEPDGMKRAVVPGVHQV